MTLKCWGRLLWQQKLTYPDQDEPTKQNYSDASVSTIHCKLFSFFQFIKMISRSSPRGSVETNLPSLHEVAGSIPRHTQRVKELELQLPAYTTVTATWDLSGICDLHQSSRQHRYLTHQSRPGIEPASSRILHQVPNLMNHKRNSLLLYYYYSFIFENTFIQAKESWIFKINFL